MKPLLSAAFAVLCASPAFAQDALLRVEEEIPLPISLSLLPQGPGEPGPWGLAILVEVTLPPEGDVETIEWKDAIGAGVGLKLELDYTVPVAAGVRLGGYASLAVNNSFGEEFTLGAVVLESDDLLTATLAAGVKLAHRPAEGLQAEARLGIGMVNYFATDAEAVASGISTEVIDSTAEFMFEAGGRVGFVAGSIVLQIGLTVRTQGEPEPADPSTIAFSGDNLLIFAIDAGLLVRF